MRTPIRLLFLFVLLASSFYIKAQTQNTHRLFWAGLAFSDMINGKLKWEASVQRRTQNSAESKADLFDKPHFASYSVMLQYRLNPNLRVSVAPFGYYESYLLNVKRSDEQLPPIKEFRWTARLEHEAKGRYVNYINRYSLEFRNRDIHRNDDYQQSWRIRYMAKLEKPLKNRLRNPVTFILYDEIFIRFDHTVFEQNRLYGGCNYQIGPNVKTSLGYIYGYQDRNFGEAFDRVNTFWLSLSFDNVGTQLAKRLRPLKKKRPAVRIS